MQDFHPEGTSLSAQPLKAFSFSALLMHTFRVSTEDLSSVSEPGIQLKLISETFSKLWAAEFDVYHKTY